MTVAPDQLPEAAEERRALLARLLRERARAERLPFGMVAEEDRRRLPAGLEDAYPVSVLQAGMLFHSELDTGGSVYHDLHSVHLRGRLDLAALHATLRDVVGSHPILRTSFALTGFQEPLQLVHRCIPLPLFAVDLCRLDESTRERVLEGWLAGERRRPFDLRRAPLVSFWLHLRGEEEFQLTVSFHHAVLDGWSSASLITDLFRRYLARVGRSAGHQPGAPVALYREFIRLERMALHSPAARRFWEEQLRDAEACVLDRWPGGATVPGAVIVDVALPERVSLRLDALAARLGVPAKSIALAAHLEVIGRLTGRDDVITGLVTNGRPEERDGERVLGLFLNTVPFRARRAEGTWEERVRRVFDTESELFSHRRFPLAEIQKLHGSGPLFDTAFNFLSYHVYRGVRRLGGLEVIEHEGYEETNFALIVHFSRHPETGRYALRLNASGEELSPGQVAWLARRYRSALGAAAADPGASPREWSLLSRAERHQVVREWNATGRVYEGPERLELRIRTQAVVRPEAVAVAFEAAHVSYRELLERAHRLATRLRALGVGMDTSVGVCVERSVELVVALLGVVETGGAYVPLDPEYPEERLRFMVADAGAHVVVAGAGLEQRVAAWGARPVAPDAPVPVPGGPAPREPRPPEALAYTIYTSGSTGRPKGAMNSHRGIVNRLAWMQEAYGLEPGDRVLQKTPASFDVSVWEFFWPLETGATLVLARPGGHRDGAYLAGAIVRQRVTTVHFVPSMLSQFVETPGVEACGASLVRVIASGEALPPELVGRFVRRLGPGVALHNLYGPTEAAVDVTSWPCPAEPTPPVVPIGRPIANIVVHVLDRRGAPAPVGVAGELHLGGVGLARGYRGRPGLTAERFLPDPLGGAGARLYRTGDLARWLPDGTVEFLGRLDFQVKVRGFRIELGEIEAALAQHPTVREAVVVPRRIGSTVEPRLVAYWVARPGRDPGADALRSHLGASLPEHMLPAFFVRLDALPLTPNGKLDRRALPAPELDRDALGAPEYAAPRTPTEHALAEIWAGVLGVDRVGVHDDFFRLGGDSILSLQVRARAAERGISFELADLLRRPTIDALAARTSDAENAPPPEPFAWIGPADRERLPGGLADAYPVARLQEGMLFHGSFTEGTALYHNLLSAHLRAPLDARKFRESLRALASRHPVLRTTFDLVSYAEPLQLVWHEPIDLLETVADLSALPPDAQARELEAWLERENRRPYAIETRPLLWFYLHRRSADSFQLTLFFHHAILDGWSVAAMMSELLGDYLARTGAGPARPVTAPEATYREFVGLERAAIDSAETRTFWNDYLAGAEPERLPRWPRPSRATERPRRVEGVDVPLPEELDDRLRRAASDVGVPLKSLLLAVHMVVLGRTTSRTDVVSGLLTNGRPERTDGERVLGLFLNSAPIRVRLPPPAGEGERWADLARRVVEEEGRMLPHRRLPLAEIQRRRGGGALFETLFNFLHFHVYDALGGETGLELLDSSYGGDTSFPLVVNASLHGRRLSMSLSHDVRELPAAQVASLAGRYRRALESAAADPWASPWAWSPLSPGERHQVVREWNATRRAYDGPERLELRVRDRSGVCPEAVAVVFEGSHVTYGELQGRARRLAARLRSLGSGGDVSVGVCVERSVELVVALLAVLESGSAYVPLDPGYPEDRLRFMVADAGLKVVVAGPGLEERVAGWGVRPVAPEGGGPTDGDGSAPHARPPEALAYTIYTSGSTGRPKGAMNSHRGIVNRLAWMQEAHSLGPADRVLQKTPASFDVSVWEFFWPLWTGATLVVARPEGHKDGGYLAETITRERVTTVHFVPSMLSQFVETAEVEACGDSLARVIASGEALAPELVGRFFARLGADVALHNLYGPTEAAVDVTAWPCRPDTAQGLVPIGRPIANISVHVLESRGAPAPVGAAGELHLGGVGLARGYRGRPGLTAERFVPDPFGEPGGRLYRTGDLARHLPDGAVEFLGRLDFQVKIRGFRVELGEIEAALAVHPGVREAVVAARRVGGSPEPRLVAYWVPLETGGPGAEALRGHLGERLPEAMVPAFFVALDALPLTPNGKLDRRALPAPELDRDALGAPEYVPPITSAEQALAGIWADVLGTDRVGLHDDFFRLGGDSILSLQVVSRARRAGWVVSPQDLFRAPTVQALARAAREADEEGADGKRRSAAVPSWSRTEVLRRLRLDPGAVEDVYPLVPVQHGMVFHSLGSEEPGVYEGQWTWDLEGAVDGDAMRRAWSWVVERHPVLRTAFFWEGLDQPVQVVFSEVEPAWEELDWRGLPVPEQERRFDELRSRIRHRGLPLDRPEMVTLTLIRLADERFRMLNVHHHALLDGWSLPVLFGELLRAYGELARGRAPDGPPPRPYRDYVQWIGERDPEETEAFWRDRVGDLTEPTPLGFGRERPAPDDAYAWQYHGLSSETSAALDRFARAHGVTLNTVVQGAWALLLGRYTGRDRVVFGTVVSGRPAELDDVERMVGLFINTLPVAVTIPQRGEAGPFLRELQRSHAELRRFEFTPLRDIHRWTRLPRGTPLFESILVFENYPVEERLADEVAALGLRIPELRSYEKTNYPVSLVIVPGDRLHLRMTHDQRRLSSAEAERMLRHLENLLAGLVEAPEPDLADVDPWSRAERHQLLHEWRAGEVLHPPEPPGPIEHLRRYARERPDAPALAGEGRTITYGSLHRRVQRLALRLTAAGVGPERVVGVWAARTPEAWTGMLAVLAAGGAYLPVEPDLPDERVRAMIREAGASRLLWPRSDLPRGVALAGARSRVLPLPPAGDDVDGAENAPLPDRFPPAPPESAAYVIFTSGSTGRPKGVVVERRQLARYLAGVLPRIGLPDGAAAAVVSTLAADLGYTTLFGTLARGGCLHLASRETATSPDDFAGFCAARRIEVLKIVPSHLEALRGASAADGAALPARCLVLGGEELRRPEARRIRDAAPGLVASNHYGPTETTIGVLCRRLDAASTDSGETVPVGRPLPGVEACILDPRGRLVPAGATGELCIGGGTVARGYAARPGLTAERFPPDPRPRRPGARIYRTGDRARQLPAGEVEFLGRVDRQIKVRGFRVELAEVEAALRLHPGIQAAAVVSDGDGRVGRLVAYVVGRPTPPEAETLQGHLSERLPRYMLPAAFVPLDELPLTPNGKLDRRALPAPDRSPLPDRASGAPQSGTEAALAAIWRELLGIAGVDRGANFFDLGGDSLSAIRLLGQISDRLGAALPPRTLFASRDLAELATLVDRRLAGEETRAAGETFDLAAEAVLDADVRPSARAARPARSVADPEELLLTGATGFVGSYLLAEILGSTRARVRCLVRAGSPEEGLARLRRALSSRDLWKEEYAKRLSALPGDLGRPLLGLSPEEGDRLAEEVDAVYHNGALVNFAFPYATHRRPNVDATREVLRLAARGSRVQPVHLVSTVSVFESTAFASRRRLTEDDRPLDSRGLPNGYVQSKWVAERLLEAAAERGVPATIHRLGRVGWHSRTGDWNDRDLVSRMVRACIRLGSVPTLDRAFPIVPVDRVVAALVWLSLRHPLELGVYHLTARSPVAWERIAGWLREGGHALRHLPFSEWQRELLTDVERSPDNPLFTFAAAAGDAPTEEETEQALSRVESARATVDSPRTRKRLAGSGIELSVPDEEAVGALLRALPSEAGPGEAVPAPGSTSRPGISGDA